MCIRDRIYTGDSAFYMAVLSHHHAAVHAPQCLHGGVCHLPSGLTCRHQQQMCIRDRDYFFVDGVSQAGWVETDAGTRYLDGNGNQMTGWCVIDGQPYAFGTNGEPKQGWDHSHEKSYYFINGVSQSGTFGEGALSSNLNGSGSVQPVGDQAPDCLLYTSAIDSIAKNLTI